MNILLITQKKYLEVAFRNALNDSAITFILTIQKNIEADQTYFTENKFDLLFFDATIAKAGNLAQIRAIKSIIQSPPIVCVSDQLDDEQFLKAGVINSIPVDLMTNEGLNYCIKNTLRLIETERHKIYTEKKLSKTEDRLGAIISNTPLALFLIDKQSIVKFGAGLLWASFTTELNLLGGFVANAFSESPQVIAAYEQSLKGTAQKVNYKVKELVFQLTFNPILNSNNKIEEVIVLALDVSAQEQGMLSLKQAKILAENTAKLKQDFIANISHDIRTPMNAIVGFSGLLLDTELTNLQLDFVQSISASSTNLVELVNDVLDYSKIEAGEIELQSEVFSLRQLVDELITVLKIRATQRKNKLILNFGDDIPKYIIGDKLKTYQILTNLVGNAIKYTEAGVIDVVINLKNKSTKSATIVFVVKDNGIGISASSQSKVFDPFTRATSNTTATNSTGLGLTIVKRIVTALNGKIDLVSELGKGSIFSVEIDFLIAKKEPSQRVFDEQLFKASLKNKKILLAEDNEMNQKLVIMYLRRFDVLIDLAENGLQAVKAVKNNDYDLILMDIQMPEMDGRVASQEIRSLNIHVPILAMTAHAFKEEVTACYDAGMTAHISKPIDKALFLETIVRLIADEDAPTVAHQKEKHGKSHEILTENIVDLDYLREMSGDNKIFILKMLAVFEKDAPELVQRMKSAFEGEDWGALSKIAHKYRSPAVMLGMKKAADIAAEIEYFDFVNGDVKIINHLIDKVEVQNTNAIAFIQAYTNE